MHGLHKDITEKFAECVKGTDVLITEGVTVSFADIDMISLEEPVEKERTEYTLLEEIKQYAKDDEGLIVIYPYNRNMERLHLLLNEIDSVGRTLVVDETLATYIHEFYADDNIFVYEETCQNKDKWQIISQKELLNNPNKYVLQLNYVNIYELIDLACVVTRFVHIDGTPLGDYDPSFNKMHTLLSHLEIPYEYKGTGGHIKPYYLREFIDKIEPKTLIPLHSFRPEQVVSEKAGEIFLPEFGQTFILG